MTLTSRGKGKMPARPRANDRVRGVCGKGADDRVEISGTVHAIEKKGAVVRAGGMEILIPFDMLRTDDTGKGASAWRLVAPREGN